MRSISPLPVAVAFVLGLAVVVALILNDRMDDHVYENVATTTDTTPSTTWLESQPSLGDRFDELLAGVARAKAAHRSRQMRASARPAPGGAPYPTDQLLERLARCETGGKMDNPNTGNGYYGFFQFDLSTWRSVGGTGYPHEHPYAVQRDRARDLILRAGWGRFPHCSRAIGAR